MKKSDTYKLYYNFYGCSNTFECRCWSQCSNFISTLEEEFPDFFYVEKIEVYDPNGRRYGS